MRGGNEERVYGCAVHYCIPGEVREVKASISIGPTSVIYGVMGYDNFLAREYQRPRLKGYLPTKDLGTIPELLIGNALCGREAWEHLRIPNETSVDPPRNPGIEVIGMPPPVMRDIGIHPHRGVHRLEEHHVGVYIIRRIPRISIGIQTIDIPKLGRALLSIGNSPSISIRIPPVSARRVLNGVRYPIAIGIHWI